MNSRHRRPLVRMRTALWAAVLAWGCTAQAGDQAADQAEGNPQRALVRLSLDQVDSVLSGVAASTRAVAGEFVLAHRATAAAPVERRAFWSSHHLVQDQTVLFQTWPGALEPAPAYQAEWPSFYGYRGERLDDESVRTLEVFRQLVPAVRAAYQSYGYSWSYVTTVRGMMLLYPFLTLDEAVNNQSPTDQTYYRHADFAHRRPGWTPPYLDLVGAGMMVTVSTPAYDGDTLLGVVSHDITLAQLSATVLGVLARDVGGTAWLVDTTGLAIAVSNAALRKELDEVNRKAGAAVLYYRPPAMLAETAGAEAQASHIGWINDVTEAILSHADAAAPGALVETMHDGRTVLAGRSNVTGWMLVWMTPLPRPGRPATVNP